MRDLLRRDGPVPIETKENLHAMPRNPITMAYEPVPKPAVTKEPEPISDLDSQIAAKEAELASKMGQQRQLESSLQGYPVHVAPPRDVPVQTASDRRLQQYHSSAPWATHQ